MDVYVNEAYKKKRGTCIALGSFDALHKAHVKLIDTAVDFAKKNNLDSGVFQFTERPELILNPEREHKILYTNEQKCRILESLGLDFVYFEKFDDKFMKLSCEQFVQMLKERFNVKCLVVGFHYSFGYKGMGNADTLKELAFKYGFEVIVIEAVTIGDTLISSTHIRKLIADGDIENANKFLGRYYSIYSYVEHDRRVGSTVLEIPTANLKLDKNLVLPSNGVYATYVDCDGTQFASVTNVGVRPTFGLSKVTVEAHLIDFSGNLYGKEIELHFIGRLRDEIKFENSQQLRIQISSDIDKVKNMFYNKK